MWLALLAGLAAVVPGDDRFVPPVERHGDRAVVPLVFTDGTRARISYPARLRLAELGVEPYSSGWLPGVGRDFVIRYGSVADVSAGWTRLADYAGAAGFWDTGPGAVHSNYLAFQFGPWVVLVYDYPPERGSAAMTDAQRAAWARNLRGRVTRKGFLRLRGAGRLRLARSGEHAGPQLTFGRHLELLLIPGRCRRTFGYDRRMYGRWVSWDRGFAAWCISRSMRAHSYAPRAYRRALIRGVRIR